jgi:choloylglycine hydrolase
VVFDLRLLGKNHHNLGGGEDMMKKLRNVMCLALAAGLVFSTTLQPANACTRILYETGTGTYITARSMDWVDPELTSDLWIFPQGLERNGGGSDNELTWTSRYGSVITAFYCTASADGMNEMGLVGNMQYLTEADFGDPAETGKPTISIGAWLQYFLDNFASVEEAVAAMQDPPFTIVSKPVENGFPALIHMSISDATGDSAIFEYLDGELVIHHGPEYVVMTNSPIYSEQLALNAYWEAAGGENFLPGTASATDRWVRASYYLRTMEKQEDRRLALATVFSLIRGVSAPVSSANGVETLWRTVADHDAKTYYFDSVISPSVFWIDLNNVDLTPGAPAMTLRVSGDRPLAGEVSSQFEEAAPFEFL